jgi:hypothetical protein
MKVTEIIKAKIEIGKVGAFAGSFFQPVTDFSHLGTTAILLIQV